MVIWVGQDYETVTFEPGRVPQAAFASDNPPEGSSLRNGGATNGESYGESEVSEEINNQFEEDQYPAQ